AASPSWCGRVGGMSSRRRGGQPIQTIGFSRPSSATFYRDQGCDTAEETRMALRIKIPLLLDATIVDDESEMAWLNNEPALSRELSGRGGWIHRLLWRKIHRTLRVNESRLLPVFEARDDPARAKDQIRVKTFLTELAEKREPFDRDAIASLGHYVAAG